MKKTLLEIVQEILSDLDSDNVNSIADSVEAEQVYRIIESTFYNMVAQRDIPEHKGILQITALSDSNYPTTFQLGSNVKYIGTLWYNVADSGDPEFKEIHWVDPLDFLSRTDNRQESYALYNEIGSGTKLRIVTDEHPTFYTTFDDEYVVLDSFKSAVDSTLQQSKVRAYGATIPTFSRTDAYTPDMDATFFPYLIAESKSVAFDVLKGGTTQKIDQAARRQKSYLTEHKYRVNQKPNWSDYGRN